MALATPLWEMDASLKIVAAQDLSDMMKELAKLQITKLEIMMARTAVKDSLPKARKETLFGEQKASYVNAAATWKFEPSLCDWKAMGWKPLLDICNHIVKG